MDGKRFGEEEGLQNKMSAPFVGKSLIGQF
jgi:hypothetical protein